MNDCHTSSQVLYFVEKGKNNEIYPERQRADKSRVVFRTLDSFKSIFVQIALTNTALRLSSSNKITYAGKGLSQSRASLKARLDCWEPNLGDFASSPVVVTQQTLGNLLKSLTIPYMKHCCFISASEEFRSHIWTSTGSQVTREKETTDIPRSPFQEKITSSCLVG